MYRSLYIPYIDIAKFVYRKSLPCLPTKCGDDNPDYDPKASGDNAQNEVQEMVDPCTLYNDGLIIPL